MKKPDRRQLATQRTKKPRRAHEAGIRSGSLIEKRSLQGSSGARVQTGSPARQKNAAAIVLLAAIGAIIYSNTFQVPFVFDDIQHIIQNPHIRMQQLAPESLAEVLKGRSGGGRPLAMLSFALNYYFGGYHPFGYHAINILVHLLSSVTLFWFIKMTLALAGGKRGSASQASTLPALLAALLWLSHPVQTQSVTYIVQRMNSMAALFFVLAMALYAKGRCMQREATVPARRHWGCFAGCVCSGACALASKQIAATLPVFILLYEWFFFQDLQGRWLRKKIWLIGTLCLFAAAIAFYVLGPQPWSTIAASCDKMPFTLTERLLTELRVVVYYVSLLLFPSPGRLTLDYDFSLSHTLLDPPTTLACLLLLAGLLVAACLLARRQRLLSFCILWFLGNLVIESSFFGLELIYEHRLYLPSMLAGVPAVLLLQRLLKTPQKAATAGLCLAALFSLWTWQRNTVWQDDLRLWEDCVRKAPGNSRALINYGDMLHVRGRNPEALTAYRQALTADPLSAVAHYNIGTLLSQRDPIEAKHQFEKALELRPAYVDAHVNLANLLLQSRAYAEAARHYEQAIAADPACTEAYINLGSTFLRMGKTHEAVASYRAAIRLDPLSADACYNLGHALYRLEQFKESAEMFGRALELRPGHAQARSNMQAALLRAREASLQPWPLRGAY